MLPCYLKFPQEIIVIRPRLVNVLVIVICTHCNENEYNHHIYVDYFASSGNFLKNQFTQKNLLNLMRKHLLNTEYISSYFFYITLYFFKHHQLHMSKNTTTMLHRVSLVSVICLCIIFLCWTESIKHEEAKTISTHTHKCTLYTSLFIAK